VINRLPKKEVAKMGKPSLADKDFLTVIETAEFYGLSRRKLFRLVEEKNLPFLAMYGTRKLVIKAEFVKYLNKPGMKERLANGKQRTKKRQET
jgi:excisionase family DNA binding protein